MFSRECPAATKEKRLMSKVYLCCVKDNLELDLLLTLFYLPHLCLWMLLKDIRHISIISLLGLKDHLQIYAPSKQSKFNFILGHS